MKKLWLVSFLVIVAVLAAALPAAAAPGENQGKGPLDKVVFVHYPKDFAAKGGPGGGGQPSPSTPDYKYSGVRWSTGSVDVWVNTSNSGVNANETETAIEASFATWAAASTGITFIDRGTTSVNGGDQDGYNVVSWGPVSYANAIAVTYIWYYRFNKDIYECDTIMNNGTGFNWSYTAPTGISGDYGDPTNPVNTGKYDIRNIMTHEAGHWIMLGDLYNGRDSFLTMYGYGSTDEIKKDTLGYGDILGVLKAYGQ